jgi:hypothetical protein
MRTPSAGITPTYISGPFVHTNGRSWERIMSAITPEPILNIATGFMGAKQLFAASEIGLFEALAGGPASLEELAGKTAVPARR